MNSYYFSHDSNARHDPKIMSIRAEFGGDVKVYAWFFMLLEIMRDHESDGYRIKMNKSTKRGLCLELGATADDFDLFLNVAIDVGLFAMTDDEFLFSDSFLSRMAAKDEISQKRKDAANKRWNQLTGNKQEKPVDDSCEIEKSIFSAWNDAAIIRHSKITSKMKSKIKAALKDYTLAELIQSIKNYGIVVNDPKYYFNYKWTLDEFLGRGTSKFYHESCFKNFLAAGQDQKYIEEGKDNVKF